MELIVALILVGGISGTLSIPFIKYKKYTAKMTKIAKDNSLKTQVISFDKLLNIISTSFDTHKWGHRYGQAQINTVASGYAQTKNFLIHAATVSIIEDVVFIIPFDEFEQYTQWHDRWIRQGLAENWHEQYKKENL